MRKQTDLLSKGSSTEFGHVVEDNGDRVIVRSLDGKTKTLWRNFHKYGSELIEINKGV